MIMPVNLYSKVKSRSIPTVVTTLPQSKTYNASNVWQPPAFGGGTLTTREGNEWIKYGVKKASMRWQSNPCKHRRYRREMLGDATLPLRLNILDPSFPGWYHMYTGGYTLASGAHATAETTALGQLGAVISDNIAYPGSAQSDIDSAFLELRPDLTGVSIPNFLAELGDVQKLYRLWKTNTSLAKNLAGLHLNYKFGWKPTIGDLTDAISILKGLEQRLEEFDKLNGQIVSDRMTISNETITKTGTFNLAGDIHRPVYWSGTLTRVKSAGMTYQILAREVTQGYLGVIRTLADALGFELNPRIIWDALPFTFVLDWFFDTGSWLEAHKIDTLNLPFLWKDSYVSFREELKISSVLTTGVNDPTGVSPCGWPQWNTEQIYFERIPCAPTEGAFSNAPDWRLPTFNQATLLVSLGTVLSR